MSDNAVAAAAAMAAPRVKSLSQAEKDCLQALIAIHPHLQASLFGGKDWQQRYGATLLALRKLVAGEKP